MPEPDDKTRLISLADAATPLPQLCYRISYASDRLATIPDSSGLSGHILQAPRPQ